MKQLLALMLILVVSISCSSNTDSTDSTDSTSYTVSGYVQKGPFVQGTEITVRELDSSLTPTGRTFTGTIDDDTGSFSAKGDLSSPYVELSADGFYFNEVSGSLSSAKLTLSALSDLSDSTSVNVNLMTHLEKKRVEYLIGTGLSFSAAKSQAQGEILKMFNIDNVTLGNSETLDISKSGDGNATLLAISAILQSDKTEAELTELLSTISTDIRTDGTLDSSTTKANLVTAVQYIKTKKSTIRSNIESRYSNLGISATIPAFESHAFLIDTPWDQYNSMTVSRKRMDAAAIGNKIYVAGGDVYPSTATDAFEVYDINTNSWSTLTSIPETRMGLSSVSFDSQFYIFGGISGSQYPYTKSTEINKYNPSSGSWSSLGNQYNGNTYMQQVSDPINNKVYWISGTSTYEFNLSTGLLTNCGSTCESLPTVTSGCNRTVISLVTLSNFVYALSDVYSDSCTRKTHLDKFDPSSNSWSYLSSSPSTKYNLTACAANSKIYILGGTYGTVQSSVEEYDPVTNTWSTKTAIPYGGLTEHACVTVDDKIYLIGGEPSGGNKTNSLYVYNPSFDN